MNPWYLPDWLPTFSQHGLIAAVALIVYLVNARARQQRRAPAAAIGWVMGLALLPYLVLPLYLAFGQRKLPVPPRHAVDAGPEPVHWSAALLASFGIAAPAACRVRLHEDGQAAKSALWSVFDEARDTLDVCTFLIGSDAFGREALVRLAERARAGVRVRLLYDGLSAWHAPRRALRDLAEAGAEVKVFRPLFELRRTAPRNLRNHRKLVVADDTRLWAGGRNLASEYFIADGEHPAWLDLSFDLTGAAALHAARQFEQDWIAAGARARAVPPRLREVADAGAGTLAQFLPSGPDQSEDTAQALLVSAVYRAQQRLIAITPYFVPDDSLLDALRLAAHRGVQITLVIPARSNHPLTDFVRGRALREMARAGAQVCLLPRMCHAKAVVVDDSLALCGSINLDARSLLLNYESAVLFQGAPEIAWLAQWITARAAEGHAFEARPPGLLRDLAEGALLAVAFQV